jgi:hypothetical protein
MKGRNVVFVKYGNTREFRRKFLIEGILEFHNFKVKDHPLNNVIKKNMPKF